MLICPILDCQPVASVGIASLSTYLEKLGHQVKLILINGQLKHSLSLEEIYESCSDFSPDIIGFSSVNSQYEIVIKIADYLKRRIKTPIVYGGSCPTVMPGECLSNESIDYVCVGEGEEALVEFLDRYERGDNCFDIANIWAKQNGKVIKNPVRPLTGLNSLYPLDFRAFEEMEQIIECRDGWFDYSLTRGCPFNCSHCQSAHLHNIYNRKYPVRYVSIDTAIKNLLEIIKTYRNIKFFNINDDLPPKKWT